MRFRISFKTSITQQAAGIELEAESARVDGGTLVVFGPDETLIVAYAPEVWRTIIAVGAYSEAVKPPEAPRENPQRR